MGEAQKRTSIVCIRCSLCSCFGSQHMLPGLYFAACFRHPTPSSAVPGMSAGVPKFVTVNLQQLNSKFQDGETVDLATLQEKRLLNLSGREAKLPLKVSSAPPARIHLASHKRSTDGCWPAIFAWSA